MVRDADPAAHVPIVRRRDFRLRQILRASLFPLYTGRIVAQTLGTVAAEADGYIARMREALLPTRLVLRRDPYRGGEHSNYADHIVGAAFVGFAPTLGKPLLEAGDPLQAWVDRGLAQAQTA